MKRHCKFIISVITMALIISLIPCNLTAYADPLTAIQIGNIAYSVMNAAGLSFNTISGTTIGIGNFMGNEINEFVDYKGSTLISIFGDQVAVDVAGKLIVGQQMYNAIVEFTDWLSDKYDFTLSNVTLSQGTYMDIALGEAVDGVEYATEYGVSVVFSDWETTSDGTVSGYRTGSGYLNGTVFAPFSGTSNGSYFYGDYKLELIGSNQIALMVHYYRKPTSHEGWGNKGTFSIASSDIHNKIYADTANYIAPTVIGSGYSWSGDIDGYSVPDTNLDQLLGGIEQALVDNSFDVVGEVIDTPVPPEPTPVPPPTPIPIDPQTPLYDVPWEGLDNNIQSLYEQGLEENGLIGDLIDKVEDFGFDIIDSIEHFFESFESIGMKIVEWLDDIASLLSDLVESIETSAVEWFSDVVDAILAPFQPWISTLHSATGLWHYIVEWLQCITVPFSFFWSVLSGIGVCFVRPIYAVAAFAIVIAIYKRFGK